LAAVNANREVGGNEIANRLSTVVEDDDVDGQGFDARTEVGRLCVLRVQDACESDENAEGGRR
jgi:hypothetical protein